MSARPSRVRSLLLRWLGRRRGDVQAIQDLRLLREVGRYATIFAVTLLAPAATLSYLALSSLRSEELSLDADLRERADAMSTQIDQELAAIFQRFEERANERARRGESPIADLQALSPYLRGGYRYDATGALVAPFELATAESTPPRAAVALRLGRRAQQLAAAGRHEEAAALWSEAARRAASADGEAEARLAEAVATAAAGRDRDAERLLADLFADHAQLRDARGFRYGDLALLKRAELVHARDPDLGTTALQQLVDDLLIARWTIGYEGEPAVVRRALARLEGSVSPEWLGRARSRLNERAAELAWSADVAAELDLVATRIPEGNTRYLGARSDSPALWAIRRVDEDLFVWSFSAIDLYQALAATTERIGDLDPDLDAHLLLPGEPAPSASLTTSTLGPWLPVVTLVVVPDDADALAAQRRRRRDVRIAIVSIAVIMVALGVANAAVIIGREVENARVKADFAANVSHELRSPITQIRLKGEALQLGLVDDGDDTRAHYDAIVHEAERLSRLVDNVLDFAAIERGAKTYHLRADDLLDLVWAQVSSHQDAFAEAGITLEATLPEDLPPVWFDRDAMGQVLTNLLSNAAKYGSAGGWVGVRVTERTRTVRIDVEDRGAGIAADEVDKVFEEFFRSVDPDVRRRKGTGIGLTIVRYIVEAHRGTITVDSERGRGTTFTVTLPLDAPEGKGA